MKHRFFFFIIALLFAACSLFDQIDDDTMAQTQTSEDSVDGGEYATVRFSLSDSNARTVFPQYDATAFFYTVGYWRVGGDETVITFTKDDKTIFDYDTLTATDTTLTVLTGDYCFSVDAFSDTAKTARVLSYMDEVKIAADTTTISFALTTAEGEGAATTGSVSVTLSYSTGSVVSATAKLCALSDLATPTDTQTLAPSANGDGTSTVVYEASDILHGTYVLFVTLTDNMGNETVIPELVIVARGVTSTNAQSPLALDETQTNTSYVLFVGGDGASDENDGRLPGTAFSTLQKAIDTIASYPLSGRAWSVLVSGTVRGGTTIPSTFSAASLAIIGRTGLDASGNPQDILNAQTTTGESATGSVLTINASLPISIESLALQNGVATNGGGIYKAGSGTLTITNCTISANTASKNGGGIYVGAGTAKLGDGVKIESNEAQFETNSDGGGGGIFVGSGASLYLYGSATVGKAGVNGGAAATASNRSNTAPYGAGIFSYGNTYLGYSDANTTQELTGGVYGNYATKGTGGVLQSGSKLFINSGAIAENGSAGNHGGVGARLSAAVTMTGGEICRNAATSYLAKGGGIGVSNSKFTMANGKIYKNAAVGTSANYSYGGGIEASNATIFIYGNAVIGGTGDGEGNSADRCGGAMYLSSVKLYLGYSSETQKSEWKGGIYGNTANIEGGGIYLANSETQLIMNSGKISGNTVTNGSGGGVYNIGTFTMSGGEISNNTATTSGGGVYIGNSASFTMSGDTLIASDNDVYLSSGKYITVGGSLTSTETVVATITPAGYTAGRQVLDGTAELLASEYGKFAVSNAVWSIDSAGQLQKAFTVTFNTKGGGTIAPQTVMSGSTATEPAAPTKDGWTFDGWMTSLDDTTVYESTKYDFGTAVTGDITLYARWKKTIQYDKGLLAATRASAAVTVYYGGTYSDLCAAEATPTITGNWATFKGWYTEYLGKGTEITADMTVDDDAPRIVYGHWELAYSTGEIGDIVLQTGKYVTAENFAAGKNDYNRLNGGTQPSLGAAFSSTVVGVVCASGWMIEPSPSDSQAIYSSAESNAAAVTQTNYTSGWKLPDEDTMRSILRKSPAINRALNAANATSDTTYIQQEGNYWILNTTSFKYMEWKSFTVKGGTAGTKCYYCAVHAL